MATKQDTFTALLNRATELSGHLSSPAVDQDERDVLSSLLREVDRYCEKHIDGAAIDHGGPLAEDIRRDIAERGWFGLTIPERYDGAGLSLGAATQVVSRLARYNGSLATAVGLHSGLALYGLIHLGSEELKQKYLPEIAAGLRIASFAATEPSAGSDLAGVKTTLKRRDDGKLVLNGTKIYVTNGGFAGILTVLARSPGLGGAKAGHTLLLVDPSWEGVQREGEENKLGLKASSTISIYFDDVVIPESHILGEMSQGMDYAYEALTWGRTFMASGCSGTAEAGYAEAWEHTRDRQQFGKSLDQFPLVRQQLADMAAEVYAVQSVLAMTCALYDHGDDIVLDSTVAKILASEGAWRVVDRGLQLMGGTGYMEDAGMARRLRDLRVTRIFEGANDVLRLHLAAATLGWPKSTLGRLPALAPSVAPAMREAAETFDALGAVVAETLIATKKKHGFRIVQKQCVQSVMADLVIATYAMLSTILRASGRLSAGVTDEPSREVALARLAVVNLDKMARRSLDELNGKTPSPERGWTDDILNV